MATTRRPAVIRHGPRNPHRHGRMIADAVADTWQHQFATDHVEIPLSALAALALLTPPAAERDQVSREWINLPAPEFANRIRGLWRWFAVTRPDLLTHALPLVRVWLGDTDIGPDALAAAKATADTALRADLLGLTGTPRRDDVDLLGVVLTVLRPTPVLQDRGQFYSPAGVSELLSRIILADDAPDTLADHQTVYEPTAGTGGLLRTTAEQMRQHGHDPATVAWVASDIDALALACLAVNVVLWRLGHRVLLGRGDTLAHDFWDQAHADHSGPVRLLRDLLRDRYLLQIMQGRRPETPASNPGSGPATRAL